MKYVLPERIKKLREEKNLTLRQLAKMTGFSHAAVCRWENGTQIPNVRTLIVFAQFFNVSTDYLLGYEDN